MKPLGDSLSYGVGPPRAAQSPGGTSSSPAARYTRLATNARKVGTNWYANDARAVVRDDASLECAEKHSPSSSAVPGTRWPPRWTRSRLPASSTTRR